MTKTLKTTTSVIAVFILLLLLAIGSLVTFVSPNKIKPILTEAVFKYSGRQLTMDGDLSWSFFPYVGVKIGHAVLSNPDQFKTKNFAEIDHATVGVKLMPLLSSAIEFSEITLSGVKINLIRNADGETNWNHLLKETEKSGEVSTPSTTDKNPNKKIYSLQIPVLDIDNAVVTFSNLQSNQSVQLNKFELHAKDISLDKPFTISSSFDYTAKNPDTSGSVTMSGKISSDLTKNFYQIKDISLSITSKQGSKPLTLNITANAAADMGLDTLTLTDFSGRLANMTLNGNVNVTHLSANPHAEGHLSALPFDLKALLQTIGQDNVNLQSAKNVSADFDFATTMSEKTSSLEALSGSGKIKIEEFQAAKLRASNVNLSSTLEKGILNISSLSASLYQGTLQSNASVNLLATNTPITFQSRLMNIQAEPLLADLNSQGSKFKIKGAGNIDVQGTTSGLNSNNMVSNLNGKTSFSFQNGVLDGINVGYYIDTANAFIHGQSPPAKGDNLTNFGNLTGTAMIKSGVLTNNDLALISPRFDSKGSGTINLVNQQINYSLQIQPKIPGQGSNDGGLNINSMTLPVSIGGTLSTPSISLDVKALAGFVANQHLQKVKDKIQDQIKSKLPGKAGDIIGNFLGR